MADDFHVIADLVADGLDLSGTEVSNILDGAPFVNALPFVQSSDGTTHKYIHQDSNPVVAFRAPNVGRNMDSSVDTVRTDTLTFLDFSFATDKAVADAWTKGPEDYIAREGLRHIRAALATLETQIINDTDSSSGFDGFAGLSWLNAAADAMVLDVGGTTASTGSSVWLVRMGATEGVAAVFKGDGPVMSLGDTIVQDFESGTDLHYPAYYTPAGGWFGLQVGGDYSVSRLASITEDAGTGLTDDDISEAIALHPIDQRPNVIVCNRRSLRQLQQSRTATNPTGAPAPIPDSAFGIPIVVSDSISNTETLL